MNHSNSNTSICRQSPCRVQQIVAYIAVTVTIAHESLDVCLQNTHDP